LENRKIRVLITKIGLDGHDLGAQLIARILRDAGMEVIYLGKFQTPERIVSATISESVDIIGISVLSPNHTLLIPKVTELLRKHGMNHVKVIVGGIIPEPFASQIMEHGVNKIFGHHSTSEEIINYIKQQSIPEGR